MVVILLIKTKKNKNIFKRICALFGVVVCAFSFLIFGLNFRDTKNNSVFADELDINLFDGGLVYGCYIWGNGNYDYNSSYICSENYIDVSKYQNDKIVLSFDYMYNADLVHYGFIYYDSNYKYVTSDYCEGTDLTSFVSVVPSNACYAMFNIGYYDGINVLYFSNVEVKKSSITGWSFSTGSFYVPVSFYNSSGFIASGDDDAFLDANIRSQYYTGNFTNRLNIFYVYASFVFNFDENSLLDSFDVKYSFATSDDNVKICNHYNFADFKYNSSRGFNELLLKNKDDIFFNVDGRFEGFCNSALSSKDVLFFKDFSCLNFSQKYEVEWYVSKFMFFDSLGNSFSVTLTCIDYDEQFFSSDFTYYLNSDYYKNLSDNVVYQDGYNKGVDVGYSQGQVDGYYEGYDDGKRFGYRVGYSDGVGQSNDYTFFGLISAVIDAPLTYFTSLFNFDLLGVNLSSFIASLFTLCVIITVVKLCIGGK